MNIFATSAVAVGFIHTAMGIDHTLPFLVLGKAQKWRLSRVLALTVVCGVAHVLSSVVLAWVGVAFGMGVQKFQAFQALRGNLAAWSLIIFGMTYAAWSFAKSRRLQAHLHDHGDGHWHSHAPEAHHTEDSFEKRKEITMWSLFIIFVLGPCEPLVPLLMVPVLKGGMLAAMKVALIFGSTTLLTMAAIVTVGYYGINLLPLKRLQVHANTMAGLAVAVSGVAIKIFGI